MLWEPLVVASARKFQTPRVQARKQILISVNVCLLYIHSRVVLLSGFKPARKEQQGGLVSTDTTRPHRGPSLFCKSPCANPIMPSTRSAESTPVCAHSAGLGLLKGSIISHLIIHSIERTWPHGYVAPGLRWHLHFRVHVLMAPFTQTLQHSVVE